MAKRLLDWEVRSETILTATKYQKIEEGVEPEPEKILGKYDLKELFPDFAEMNEVQQFLIEYGAKQKLADGGSNKVGDAEGKIEVADARWELWKTGKLNLPRANSTGASEERNLGKGLKKVASSVTMSGLIMKREFFPETFTKEDEKKLTEFLIIAGKEAKKAGK